MIMTMIMHICTITVYMRDRSPCQPTSVHVCLLLVNMWITDCHHHTSVYDCLNCTCATGGRASQPGHVLLELSLAMYGLNCVIIRFFVFH